MNEANIQNNNQNISESSAVELINNKPVRPKSIFIAKTALEWLEYARNLPDPEKLFGPFWYLGELCFFFSDTGTGKSVLSVQIAQSIATGNPIHEDMPMSAQPQKVLYLDFELSPKQFGLRYTKQSSDELYSLSPDIIRVSLNLNNMDFQKKTLQECVIEEIKHIVKETGIKILIVDNLTFIKDTNDFKDAIAFMQTMNRLKFEFGLSILVLGHTTKRDLRMPIDQNSMGGSKKLIDLADSCFAIGQSSKTDLKRYVKQIKVRQAAMKYGTGNVLDVEITNSDGFLRFEVWGSSPEFTHLKQPNPKENRNEQIKEDYGSGNYTQKQLAEKYDLTDRTIRSILNKNEIEDDMPF